MNAKSKFDHEKQEAALLEGFVLKEKKEDKKHLAKATAFQEEKMLFKWAKLGFQSGDTTIKKVVERLAANLIKSKCRAYDDVSLVIMIITVIVIS